MFKSDIVLLEKLTWPELEERMKKCDVVLLPVGSTEQHGRHSTFGHDTLVAFELAKRAAERAGVVVAPVIPYGYSPHHMGFPGTITLEANTLNNVYKEVCRSLIKHGFKKIIIVNAHGGNNNALNLSMREIKEETGAFMALMNWYRFAGDIILKICTLEPPGGHGFDAGTSIAWYLGVDIREDQLEIRESHPPPPPLDKYYPRIELIRDYHEMTESGSDGNSTVSSKEKGKKIVDHILEEFTQFLEDIKAMKVELLQ